MQASQAVPLETETSREQRSRGSLEFEALWRALPRRGLIPDRGDFDPARAPKFLRKLILVEGSTPRRPGLFFRVAGEALNENVQFNMAGANWLDFLPQEHHAEALEAACLISEHPCGVWQLTPVHYERGYSQRIEVTILPLGRAGDGTPLMLGYLEFLPSAIPGPIVRGKGLSAETSKIFEFIDIGNGIPVWNSPRP